MTTPLDVPTLLSAALDTAEDALQHAKRLISPPRISPPLAYDDASDSRTRIVILGMGWAAHAMLKVIDAVEFRVIVVSPRAHFLFTPMLAATAVGTVEYRSILESTRASNPLAEVIEGTAFDVDPIAKVVDIKLVDLLDSPVSVGRDLDADFDPASSAPPVGNELCRTIPPPSIVRLKYDHLVVACGARVNLANVPGATSRCHRLKEIEDARELRKSISEAFERASRVDVPPEEVERLLTFVVVGGGPTGVELCGELTDLIKLDLPKLYPLLAARARVLLVHGGDELLAPFDGSLRQAAAEGLQRRGVRLQLRSRVECVEEKTLTVRQKTGGETPTRTQLPYGVCVWCAGTQPQSFSNRLLTRLPAGARSADGRIRVDDWLRVAWDPVQDTPTPALGSILAIGDAACEDFALENAGATKTQALPQTAQVAAQQGAFVAHMINRQYDLAATPPRLADDVAGKPTKPALAALRVWLAVRGASQAPKFQFINLGVLAYIGGGEALSQLQVGDLTLLKEAGSVGFLLWRSVYIVKQVALRNRILVTSDWIKTFIFGRDLTRF